MDLLPKTLEFCKKHNIKPSRSKSQNFLINEEIYDNIIQVADLDKDDIVLEVGPGPGILTEKMAERVKKVIAVELDDKLAGILKEDFKEKKIKNVKIINQNILDFEVQKEIKEDYKIVANIPYNITSYFLRKFLSQEKKPESLILMLQKEVAERIMAKPPKMNLLAISVQYYAEAEIKRYVSRENFYPSPQVDSAIVKILLKEVSYFARASEGEEKDFFRLVRFGFSAKRKMLKNNLAGGYHVSRQEAGDAIKRSGFRENIRPQELSINDFKKLLKEFGIFS